MLRVVAIACGLLLVVPCKRSAAQEALVLSGGGSRGLAHAGVFLGLKERGYDPDIVVGTSMGAVVGALYAAGYEPEEIRDRLVSVGWGGLFIPTPAVIGAERAIRYPMLNLDLDLARFRVSRGLLGQWRINRALAHLLFDANARSRGNFDRLARRYRAVAADLQTGDAVVIDRGDLARAVRASMAVPGFFAPVQWDTLTLVDGGITNNLPTDVARRLGAVRVIASDVSRPPAQIHSLAPFAVIGRAIDLMQENTQRDTIRPDVLVLPEIEAGFSGATFPEDATSLIELGLQAARKQLPPAIAIGGAGQRPLPAPPDSFSALALEAPDSALAALARRAFAGVAPGRYDIEAVASAVDALYTTGLFEAVWPRVVESGTDSTPALIVRLDGPPRLSLSGGAHFESDRGVRGWASIDRYTALAKRPVVLSVSASLEGLQRSVAVGTRIHSLLLTGVAWTAGAHVQERDVRDFGDDVITTNEVLRSGAWFGVEFPHILRERSTIITARGEWIDVENGEDGWSVGPLVRWAEVDPAERVVGVPLLLQGERRWGDVVYTALAARGSYTVRILNAQLAPLFDVRGVSANAPIDVHPALGDEHLVPGLRWGEERGLVRTVAGFDFGYPVMTGFVALRMRSGTVVNEIADVTSARWISGAQAVIVWPSPIGAVEVGYGLATVGDGRFEVSVGRRF